MASKLYEPSARERHTSFSVEGKVYVWGGTTGISSEDASGKLATLASIEQFDPYLEVWSPLNTVGLPHPGLYGAACSSFEEQVYVYGGHTGEGMICSAGVLSCLDMKTSTWSLLYSPGGPMGKTGCGMVHFHHDKLAVIGGHGFPITPQPGSLFIMDARFTDGRGWTNEIHVFDISQGVWFSPPVRGIRPPPCSTFTLTSIDDYQALLFGGCQPEFGRVNDLYLFDFNTMEITKVEPCEGEPWPLGRAGHAACCLGDHNHLLVTGGISGDGVTMVDIWLFNLTLRKWTEVPCSVTSILPRVYHSAVTITLCPGLVAVVVFGGRIEMEVSGLSRDKRAFETVAETAIITFSQVGSGWELVSVVNKNQQDANAQVRERIMKLRIGEMARTTISLPQASERVLQERVDAAVREERLRVQEIERRLQERAEAAEERSQDLEATLGEERQRIQTLERRHNEVLTERQRANQRVRETEEQLAATQERERMANLRVQEAQQQAQQRVEELEQATEEQLRQAEERVQAAERRSHDLQQRAHDAEQRSHDLHQRVHAAEQHTVATERRLHEVEQRAGELERRARQAEALVQQSQQESHWLVQRREIELTEEERGRGGWAVVKVANFRGTRVAAKCFYQQILVSRYNRQLFNREMNMAARLRHPNLVQFIGASLEGEPIILTELMTTSLRVELEKGPIQHAHTTSISLDVAQALNYLHLMQPHPIIHRDISSANVLLDPLPGDVWKAKVSDYGSVNLLRELRTVGPGSPVYAAPEASIPAEQSPKMDIFSFGVLLIEMLTNEFPAEDARQQLLDSINYAGYLDLIRRCLREQREERPSANEIITNIRDM